MAWGRVEGTLEALWPGQALKVARARDVQADCLGRRLKAEEACVSDEFVNATGQTDTLECLPDDQIALTEPGGIG